MTPNTLLAAGRLARMPVLSTQTDERLVDLVRSGCGEAFVAIVERYRAPMERYCRRMLGPERVDDAVQQIFLNAYQALHRSETELDLRPWLYRIARNVAIDLHRAQAPPTVELDLNTDGVERPEQALERLVERPEQALERHEEIRRVLSAVQALPERQRDAIVMRELGGESYEQIANELGATHHGVRQLLVRARTTLRSGVRAITPAWLMPRLWGGTPVPTETIASRMSEAVAAAGAGSVLVHASVAAILTGAVVGGAPMIRPGDHQTSPPAAHASEAADRPATERRLGVAPPGSPDRRRSSPGLMTPAAGTNQPQRDAAAPPARSELPATVGPGVRVNAPASGGHNQTVPFSTGMEGAGETYPDSGSEGELPAGCGGPAQAECVPSTPVPQNVEPSPGTEGAPPSEQPAVEGGPPASDQGPAEPTPGYEGIPQAPAG